MKNKKNATIKDIVINKNLLIDDSLLNKDRPQYQKFNDLYNEFCELFSNQEQEQKRIEIAIEIALVIANEFDFNELNENKNEYIALARDILYIASSKPINDSRTLLCLIKALYGQTNIAYNQTGEHKKVNFEDGNEWVDYLEKNTDDRTIKSYALTLRAFQYIVYGASLELSVDDRLKKAEKDLLYASKWDEENYLAFYSLGLLYSDNGNSKYNIDKAKENFNKSLSFKTVKVNLDQYLSEREKDKVMNNANKKIKELK